MTCKGNQFIRHLAKKPCGKTNIQKSITFGASPIVFLSVTYLKLKADNRIVKQLLLFFFVSFFGKENSVKTHTCCTRSRRFRQARRATKELRWTGHTL